VAQVRSQCFSEKQIKHLFLGGSLFNFLGNTILCCRAATLSYTHSQCARSPPIPHTLANTWYFLFYLIVILVCFSLKTVILNIVSCAHWSFVYRLWRTIHWSPLSFSFNILGFELGAVLYHLSHTSSLFCPGYFGTRISLFAQASLDQDPPVLAALHSWGDRRVPPCSAFFCWGRGLKNFLPSLASNHDPPGLSLQSS
jgi:hypothetical protein